MKRGILVLLVIMMLFSQNVLAQDTTTNLSPDDTIDVQNYLENYMDFLINKYNGEITKEELMQAALKGMMSSMDKYTTYFTKEEQQSFMESLDGSYSGIGVQMTDGDEYIVINKVFNGSPAEKAGLMAGDEMISVNGESLKKVSLEQVATKIKGPTGTTIKMTFRRNKKELFEREIIRETIIISPVTYKIDNNVGYIKIDSFNSNTSEFFDEALVYMDSHNISKLILDLRDNPGGEVQQAVNVARKLTKKGLITKLDFKDETTADIEYYSYNNTLKYTTAVLVNEWTASASEILAAAIQELGGGFLVGTNTFGKGVVQSLYPMLSREAYEKYSKQVGAEVIDANSLFYNYGIMALDSEISGWSKMTTGHYLTPKGRYIHGIGLKPNLIVEPLSLNGVSISSLMPVTGSVEYRLDTESDEIKNVESILKFLGYEVDEPDNYFDKKTNEAIVLFQRENSLKSDGVIRQDTRELINNKLQDIVNENGDLVYKKAHWIITH